MTFYLNLYEVLSDGKKDIRDLLDKLTYGGSMIVWGESRYVVVLPMNEDGITGPFVKYYEITMTGVSSPAHY